MLVVAFVITKASSSWLKLGLALGLPAFLCLMTIGSVTLDPIALLTEHTLSDPTYTGRDEIWQFAIERIAQRPIVGYGYQAFWGTDELATAALLYRNWVYATTDAHNAFLNIALMTGMVGLLLVTLWAIIMPMADYVGTRWDRNDDPLTLLFVQIWLFSACLSSLSRCCSAAAAASGS